MWVARPHPQQAQRQFPKLLEQVSPGSVQLRSVLGSLHNVLGCCRQASARRPESPIHKVDGRRHHSRHRVCAASHLPEMLVWRTAWNKEWRVAKLLPPWRGRRHIQRWQLGSTVAGPHCQLSLSLAPHV